MPVNILKKKSKQDTITPTTTTEEEITSLAEAFGKAKSTFTKLNASPEYLSAKKLEASTKKALISAFDTAHDAEESQVYNDGTSVVTVGAKATSRSVKDMHRIRDLLGEEVFMELVSIKLSDVDDYLTPEQRGTVLESNQSGARKVVVKSA